MPLMAPRLCQVCNELQSKYKCPTCLAPYTKVFYVLFIEDIRIIGYSGTEGLSCSITITMDVPCEKPVKIEENPSKILLLCSADSQVPVHRPLNVDGPGEVLQMLHLESIASSSEIRNALEDESLQRLIRSIDSSADPEKELDKAMDVEAFRILSDKILSSLYPSLQA